MIDGRPAAVAELWRYPVKSMRGERIDASAVSDVGLTGDRAYAVVDAETGKVGSAKHPRLWSALLQCEARFTQPPDAGAPLPPVTITLPGGDETGSADPDVDDRLSAVLGHPVRLTTGAPVGNSYLAVWPRMEGVVPDDFREQSAVEGDEQEGTVTDLSLALAATPGTFFDVSALHVVTTATLDHLGTLAPGSRFAVERYRPNIVIEGAGDPFAENGWSGAALHVGDALDRDRAAPDDALHHDDARAGRPAAGQRGLAHPHPSQPGGDPRPRHLVVRRRLRRSLRARPGAGRRRGRARPTERPRSGRMTFPS